jgi:hypothetical protein
MFNGASNEGWELTIVDAALPAGDLGGVAVGDVDGDGRPEIVIGPRLYYSPQTFERYVISDVGGHVGMALEDVDGDGRLEIVVGHAVDPAAQDDRWRLSWFKAGRNPRERWEQHVIDPEVPGGAHDVLFADLDGDGRNELIIVAIGRYKGFYAYKPEADVRTPWRKHVLHEGVFMEGTDAADVDGDGRVEIVSGPYLFRPPRQGAFSGRWSRSVIAPGFREMCRAAFVDITGNGRPDVVIAESEFLDGRLSWFENRVLEDADNPWREHPMDRPLYYAHSLTAWRERDGGVRIFVAEMAKGGWDAPRNWDARLVQYTTADAGRCWEREVAYEGAGTHQALAVDLDGDGVREFVGKECYVPRVQIWKRRQKPSPLLRYRHRFLDRDKACTATDIVVADVDGDGRDDVLCASWWYRNPTWERREIPGIYQVVNACDLDGDGRAEIIATKRRPDAANWYAALSSELCWLKPADPLRGRWEEHPIGRGDGAWPHGTAVGPVLPGGRLALIAGYHGPGGRFPELFEVPDDPAQYPWPKRIVAEIPYGEEIIPVDLTGSGRLDLVAGHYWLENMGDGTFRPHQLAEGLETARVAVADVNGDGRLDIVIGEEKLGEKETPFSRVLWLEQPADPRRELWPMHVVDTVRCPHSIAAADLDGDGEAEIVCGEHDKLYPYRSRSRLLVYKKADPAGRAWRRYTLDDRFEHHDGTRIIQLAPGRLGILSHGWAESRYLHLWEPR